MEVPGLRNEAGRVKERQMNFVKNCKNRKTINHRDTEAQRKAKPEKNKTFFVSGFQNLLTIFPGMTFLSSFPSSLLGLREEAIHVALDPSKSLEQSMNRPDCHGAAPLAMTNATHRKILLSSGFLCVSVSLWLMVFR
jgi:hypothetical protein